MSRPLLNTTVLVDPDRSKTSLDEPIADDDEVAIAAITVAELLVGCYLADETHHSRSLHHLLRRTTPAVDDADAGAETGPSSLQPE